MTAYPTSESSEAYIALGANLGDREQTLRSAIALLDAHEQIQLLRCSGIYETDPVGYLDQPAFLNMVITVTSTLSPQALLACMLQVEQQLGRERSIRWGPRTVDLDLLWMEDQSIQTEELELPHPRMKERAFVLVPLADVVAADTPVLHHLVQTALETVEGKGGVRLWKTCVSHIESEPSGS